MSDRWPPWLPRFRAADAGLWRGGLVPLESYRYADLDVRAHQDFWKHAGSGLFPKLQAEVVAWREEFALPAEGLRADHPNAFFAWRERYSRRTVEGAAGSLFPRLGLPALYKVAWQGWLLWNEVIWLDDAKVQVGGLDFEQAHGDWIEVRIYRETRPQDLLAARVKLERACQTLLGHPPRRQRPQRHLQRDVQLYRWVRKEGMSATEAAHRWNARQTSRYSDDFAELLAQGLSPEEAEQWLEGGYAEPALDAATVRAAVARLERELAPAGRA
ncbi:MAG: hypothetical protein M5U01_20245 [Ardenticatenaceae bacterium]|nr:hypothetical protein [Ardenticatenaceae bacterium]HBY93333.1 hypothetical protein [Chloroflexota bacterium]